MHRPLYLAAAIALLAAAPVQAENTGPINSDTNPAICDPGSYVTSVKCSGAHCAAVEIECSRVVTSGAIGKVRWTPLFSEEEGSMSCPNGFYLAGLACNRPNCDRMSMFCAEAINVPVGQCQLNDPVSTGVDRRFSGPAGTNGVPIARSMTCIGSQCDKLQFDVCMARAEPPATDCMTSTPKFGFGAGVDPASHPYSCTQRPLGADDAGNHWFVQIISGIHRRSQTEAAPPPCNVFGRPVPCDTNSLRACAATLNASGALVPKSGAIAPAICGANKKTGGNGCAVCGEPIHGEHPREAVVP